MASVRTATVMFTDVVASTARSARLGPTRAEELRREHFDLVRQALGEHRGVEVKTLGDGVMGVFDSVVDGVNAAVTLQQALEAANRANPDALELRVGLSVGEVSTEAGDVFGTPVVEAARLCADANPRQILCTSMLRALAEEHLAQTFRDIGTRQLKGFANPTAVDEVMWVPLVEPGIIADFAHIDHAGSQRFVESLDRQQQLPFFGEVRQHLIDLLAPQPGQTLLDVGCGAGDDVIELARRVGPDGLVIGIDKSDHMLDVARTRAADQAASNVEFRVGDAQDLPLDDHSVDGARSDRVFQYLTNPARGVRELVRVTRPGGSIVVADTDWGASMFDCDDLELAERLDRAWTQTRPSGHIGRRLYGLFVRAGLDQVRVYPQAFAVTDLGSGTQLSGYGDTFLTNWASQAVEAGTVTAEEASRWIALQQAADREGRFFRFLAMFIVTGHAPKHARP
jgi:ubiquinone/menaquinone biosynthesis C-methylase UbiE